VDVTARGTRTLRLDADPETTAMILHAAARGACRTRRGTVVTLLSWPIDGDRAVIRVQRSTGEWPTDDLDPVCCGNCHAPASPDLVRRGLDLCSGCSNDLAHEHL